MKKIMENHKHKFGCLMGVIGKFGSDALKTLSRTIISDDILYTVPDDDYGREEDFHITLKYGFAPDLNLNNIKDICKDLNPFFIYATGISLFKNSDYDVVKLDINLDSTLTDINSKCNLFPHVDTYTAYHPHITLAYCKPGLFTSKCTGKNIPFLIDFVKYGSTTGKKTYHKL